MTTWLDDLKKTNPQLAADYALVGNQPMWALRKMKFALHLCRHLNTPDDEARLQAIERILKRGARRARAAA